MAIKFKHMALMALIALMEMVISLMALMDSNHYVSTNQIRQ
jgi:hypothetical protein